MSGRSYLTFHGSLNDFLPPKARRKRLAHDFCGYPSLKDTIESRGVPHPEVVLVTVDSKPVSIDDRLPPGVEIEVFPAHLHPVTSDASMGIVRPPGPVAFALDVHLGNLARSLRMLGFDCWYSTTDVGDAEIAALARDQVRVVLTRDIGLLKRSAVRYGHWLRHKNPRDQLREVIAYYQIDREDCHPFTRCLSCNELLTAVPKSLIRLRVPVAVYRDHHEFHACPACDRIFWKGGHYQNMKALLDKLWQPERVPEPAH